MKDGGPAVFTCKKCGSEFVPKAWNTSSRDYRCPPCKRDAQNATNHADPEKARRKAKAGYKARREYYMAYWSAKSTDSLHKKKRAARRKVATEIEAGRLVRQPCEKCGALVADAHHEDYDKPLDIRWLCRPCHFQEDGHGRAQVN